MHPSGFQFLILALNSGREFEFLISAGKRAHVLGPLNEIVSVPLETVWIFEHLNAGWWRKLYGLTESGNISFIKGGFFYFVQGV